MKKLFKDAEVWLIFLPVLFLSSCKEGSAFGGGLWFIPLAGISIVVWCLGRYAYGWGDYKAKGSKFALLSAVVIAAVTIGAIIWMLNDK